MDWLLIAQIVYIVLIIGVLLRIIYDTQSVTKTLAYLLLVIFLPFVGAFIYFSFGVNYRKNKLYSKKIILDRNQEEEVLRKLDLYNTRNLETTGEHANFSGLMKMVYQTDRSPLTTGNSVQLLINGEEKFPEVLTQLRQAKHHIHIEYYIYEDDETGRSIEEILVQKAQEGVEVRFIYDDFGSSSIRKNLVRRLRAGGVEAYPFYRIKLIKLANRLNYRNHRKIIVIDGRVSFVGGINVSDRYDNSRAGKNELFWRDTHLKIEGDATAILQHIFIGDWNYCSGQALQITNEYFPRNQLAAGEKKVQIVSSGPDSDRPSIYYSIIKTIQSAEKEICLTSPYFIPGETIIDAIKMAALSGVEVKLLVPGVSDSYLVNAAAKSYYAELLQAGVRIFLYQKGFVHAKTVVADRKLAIVGTANLDYRSFDLNFEVNALVYDADTAQKLADNFENDLNNSSEIHLNEWLKRPKYVRLTEKVVRLVSPML